MLATETLQMIKSVGLMPGRQIENAARVLVRECGIGRGKADGADQTGCAVAMASDPYLRVAVEIRVGVEDRVALAFEPCPHHLHAEIVQLPVGHLDRLVEVAVRDSPWAARGYLG